MRILILGGTRFLGRRVAEVLANLGHDLTVLSRRHGGAPKGTRQICDDRETGLATLQGNCFDLVLDFICYDDAGIYQLAASIVADRYVLISSTWLPRLWSGNCADELAKGTTLASLQLPKVTINYLKGKMRAEHALVFLRKSGCNAVSLRLPIIFGEGDHTGRFEFYRRRLISGGPLIIVDGGQNYAQIAVMEDLAQAIVCWIIEKDISLFPVWEALPDAGRRVRNIIATMAATACVNSQLLDVPSTELAIDFPIYLEHEPLWRESSLPITSANIYSAVGMVPAVFGQDLSKSGFSHFPFAELRTQELNFLANRHDA